MQRLSKMMFRRTNVLFLKRFDKLILCLPFTEQMNCPDIQKSEIYAALILCLSSPQQPRIPLLRRPKPKIQDEEIPSLPHETNLPSKPHAQISHHPFLHRYPFSSQ